MAAAAEAEATEAEAAESDGAGRLRKSKTSVARCTRRGAMKDGRTAMATTTLTAARAGP
jgi:hypothetical protein